MTERQNPGESSAAPDAAAPVASDAVTSDTAASDAVTPRPARPQYGEYATPEEVALARGIPVDRGANEHVSRLAEPIAPPPSTPRRPMSAPPGRPVVAAHPMRGSLLTVLLLVFGIWNTVTSIPSFLDLGAVLSQGLEAAGYGSVAFGETAHVVGIVLVVFSFLVMIAAVGLSLRRIRAGRPSLRVPLLAGLVWVLGLLIAMTVVVANTPGVAVLMQNHS